MSAAQRIWDWLPARRDRRRVTVPSVIAAELNLSVAVVSAALLDMERGAHVIHDAYGSWHRGVPLATPPELPEGAGLWEE